MQRLVTSVFYEREEAERAVQGLKERGIPADDIFVEAEVSPLLPAGRKGGAVGRAERERRFAGLETGLVIGTTVGFLAGMSIGLLGDAIVALIRSTGDGTLPALPALLANPFLAGLVGALIGLIAGGLIGWVVDFTLTRLGAGPALPAHETLVTVRAEEGKLDQVYAALVDARARHLHVADHAATA